MSEVNKKATNDFIIGIITGAILGIGWGIGIGFLLLNK